MLPVHSIINLNATDCGYYNGCITTFKLKLLMYMLNIFIAVSVFYFLSSINNQSSQLHRSLGTHSNSMQFRRGEDMLCIG
jgi:hypothetical protein